MKRQAGPREPESRGAWGPGEKPSIGGPGDPGEQRGEVRRGLFVMSGGRAKPAAAG